MNIYDNLIKQTNKALEGINKTEFAYDKSKACEETEEYEMIMQKDAAFEIGEGGKPAFNYTCVTTDDDVFKDDGICVYGNDLCEKGGTKGYIRIVIAVVKENEARDEDSKKVNKLLEDIEFVKYHVYPKGFMFRTSGQSTREQVRVSKNAFKEDLSYENIGNCLINHYREIPEIKKVKVLFVTDESADFKLFEDMSVKSSKIRKSMSDIIKGMPKDCVSCNIKELCGEIEGLKKLHFGMRK